jgi:hypothetical protein
MGELPVSVGNRASQEKFVLKNRAFIAEYTKLSELLDRIFIRVLPKPSLDQIEKLKQLPSDDPSVIAFEDKISAERIVFFLGRIAVDDFGEIMILAGNGYGFGAHKIVRGMYERVVTAMYIAKYPSEARRFAMQSAIDKFKLWERTVTAFPDLLQRKTEEEIQGLRAAATEARQKLREPTCSKCKQPLPDQPWTRKGLDAMAREVDLGLYKLYGQLYLEGTAQSPCELSGHGKTP